MAALHDRNRMLEHAGEVSAAALAWLAGGAAIGGANPHLNQGVADSGDEEGDAGGLGSGQLLL